MKTHVDVLILFKQAKKLKRKLQMITGDEYYSLEDDLKEILREILRLDFTVLSKLQLIEFLGWCSSHRPAEPWQVLLDLKMRFEK